MPASTAAVRLITDDGAWAAGRVASGDTIAHAFANFYVITTRRGRRDRTAGQPDEGPPARSGGLDHRSTGVHPRGLGPRPAARAAVPPDRPVHGRRLLQPRSVRLPRPRRVERAGPPLRGRRRRPHRPGHRSRLRCASNAFLAAAAAHAATTCSTSRRPTAPATSPAPTTPPPTGRPTGCGPSSAAEPGFLSSSIPTRPRPGPPIRSTCRCRPRSSASTAWSGSPGTLARTWSWSGTGRCVEAVRDVLAEFGFGLVLGPRARTRLMLRDYTDRMSDR